MIRPELFDVVELLVELPNTEAKPGSLGTIVEEYEGHAYEVEFANSEGETIDMRALTPDQFVVVWKNETKSWVLLADRLRDMANKLSEDRQEQILDFVRNLYQVSA
ncbi:MAG: DUF4926 domain-containing protein [Leptolyngbyaceae cyanobacterium SM2_5_2]|nr:DUF4926 domain-containing protein [Leptolyngbyaceae cyanobacterium SM2_5_2]